LRIAVRSCWETSRAIPTFKRPITAHWPRTLCPRVGIGIYSPRSAFTLTRAGALAIAGQASGVAYPMSPASGSTCVRDNNRLARDHKRGRRMAPAEKIPGIPRAYLVQEPERRAVCHACVKDRLRSANWLRQWCRTRTSGQSAIAVDVRIDVASIDAATGRWYR
jgi:hypothetical protein